MSRLDKYKDYVMSMEKFFSSYYGIPNDILIDFSHEDIERCFPYVESISFDEIFSEDVYRGMVLLVRDKKKNIVAYRNPFVYENEYSDYEKSFEENSLIDVDLFSHEKKSFKSDFDDMSDYELILLMKTLKREKKYNLLRNVSKEFYFRKDNHCEKRNKIRKKVLNKKIIEEDFYD